MDFGEVVAATAIGATIPVVFVRFLDRRAKRKEAEAFGQTGLGRYMGRAIGEVDSRAGELADKLAVKPDDAA